MSQASVRALVLERHDGSTRAEVRGVSLAPLAEGEVRVRVSHSDLNYKDGLAVTGKGRIVRAPFPFVPGIDLAGKVEQSRAPAWKPGDEVLVTGWGLGELRWGGFARAANVPAEWLTRIPAGLTPERAMALGTAGFTAMLAVMALEERGLDDALPVVVTGASGGVGSVAVALLAGAGHRVAAATGSPDAHDYLRGLGASEIVEREELAAPDPRPLESERWGGAVDTVGGATLARLTAGMARGAAVAVCGNAGGVELHTTVFPFILRGAALLGIDSMMCPPPRRQAAWERLAREMPPQLLDRMTETIPLPEVPAASERIVRGGVRGRTVIDVNG